MRGVPAGRPCRAGIGQGSGREFANGCLAPASMRRNLAARNNAMCKLKKGVTPAVQAIHVPAGIGRNTNQKVSHSSPSGALAIRFARSGGVSRFFAAEIGVTIALRREGRGS